MSGQYRKMRCRIRKQLSHLKHSTSHGSCVADIERIISTVALEDLYRVLCKLNGQLDLIEKISASSSKVQDTIDPFRNYLARMGTECFHHAAFLSYVESRVEVGVSPRLAADFRHVQGTLDRITARIGGLHQILMSSMAIAESQKALQEAENVGKLTQLAFFFIPLTFVAGLFGMNIVASSEMTGRTRCREPLANE